MGKARFIPGIYNYCDYWCERCAFTTRCRNFAMGDELEAEAAGKPKPATASSDRDKENREFWDDLDTVFHEARGQLEELSDGPIDWPEELDIDPAELAEYEEEERRIHDAVHKHELMRLASAYRVAADRWLETAAPGAVKQAVSRIVADAKTPAFDQDPQGAIDELEDLIEVVRWYHTLLYPKTGRLLHSLLEGVDEIREGDLLGTGKILLVSIDRSIAAWMKLMQAMPEQEDAMLPLLAKLGRMRHGIEEAVPKARAFQRPGLDG